MNLHRLLLESAVEALRRVVAFDHPADAVLSRYFRDRRTLGQSERVFVAEGVYGVLRHKRVLDRLAGADDPRRLLLAWLVRFQGRSVRDLERALRPGESEWLRALKTEALEDLPLAVQAELPDWVWERLGERFDVEDGLALGRALQAPAPLDLRVNLVKSSRPAVLERLRQDGLEAGPTPYSPVGVRLAGKPAINRHPLFLEGAVEVQDEGSQLVPYLVAPRRHDLVVDFCAGAGGKALMLGAMMHSQGRLYAFDVSSARLGRLKPRLARSGLSNIHPQVITGERDPRIKRLAGKIDRVLVDAPCSGLGTLRRNPDLKWRQSPQSVLEMREKQAAILRAAAGLVKPGGRLVYATCSLLKEENEDIVESFLANDARFAPLSCADVLQQHGIAVGADRELRLWPHRHGTDGFFAAVLVRGRS